VQPAASAGATLQAIWFTGQFHGVMSPQTPIGSRRIRVEPRSSSNLNAGSTFAISKKCPSPAAAWAARESQMGAPISCEMVSAISSYFAW
jgi:hypothetical protein